MAQEHRPDPDALLAAVQREEGKHSRGRLKIFLGMSAGVGKTYTMLEAAQQLQSQGVDVVVALVETHGRAETKALLDGLEMIPRRQIPYRDSVLEEMDLDAVVARKPRLALVDELAHSNAPGSRHAKRYQDVLELLEANIDVYTTLNVQHVESRADTVQQITGIRIHETVPDSILEVANEIELIDLAPEDLRKRLFEGKVYVPERVDVAADNFFRVGNLTALREMALRLTAERVDQQLRDYMQVKHIAGPWKSGERLMVAVGPAPLSEQLVRWTRRLAFNLEASWIAVHVETTTPLSDAAKQRLMSNLSLARELGAEVVTTEGNDIAETLVRVAHQQNVSQIVVGKPLRSRLQELFSGGSLVDKLIRSSGDVDIYVVTAHEEGEPPPRQPFRLPPTHSNRNDYLIALAAVTGVTAISLLLLPVVGYQAVGLVELLVVLLIAVFVGRGPALMAAFLTAIAWDFLFIPPRFTFTISMVEDAILFGLYFLTALVAGNLTARLRTQERLARFRAERTQALYALTREIATAQTLDDVVQSAVKQVGQVFDADVAIFLQTPSGQLQPQPHMASTLTVDERDYSVAVWAFQNSRPAGKNTNTLAMARAQYLPLLTQNGPVGVIAIDQHNPELLTIDQVSLLETFTSQVALGIEREFLDEAAAQSAMLRESERLHATLLNSISHELRTPIAAILGAASSLMNRQSGDATQQTLTQDIHDAGERLNRLVANLLDISRLESGRLSLKLEWSDISDLIGVALTSAENRLSQHPVRVDVAPDLPLIQIDFVLMEQVLVNILDNAALYTPPGTEISVKARSADKAVEIVIEDNGPGLPDDPTRLFDKFTRGPSAASGGTGLGLAIVRGLVEAHGGTVSAESREPNGARFIIQIPVTGAAPPVHEAFA
jgi:two-component system sensor histidine kinase KdpD